MKTMFEQVIDNTFHFLPTHAKTLLGQRKAGSQWGDKFICNSENELLGLLLRGKATEMVDHRCMNPGVRYFLMEFDAPCGKTGFTRVDELHSFNTVHVTKGAHGLELSTPRTILADDITKEAWMIVGLDDETTPDHQASNLPVIYTIYPGALTKRIPLEWISQFKEGDEVSHAKIDRDWAIKFV